MSGNESPANDIEPAELRLLAKAWLTEFLHDLRVDWTHRLRGDDHARVPHDPDEE